MCGFHSIPIGWRCSRCNGFPQFLDPRSPSLRQGFAFLFPQPFSPPLFSAPTHSCFSIAPSRRTLSTLCMFVVFFPHRVVPPPLRLAGTLLLVQNLALG